MGFHLTTNGERATPAISLATPKTHTPVSRLKERGYRYYSPSLGRWLSRDPIEEEGGVNVYAYCANAPVNQADPFGLWSWVNSPPRDKSSDWALVRASEDYEDTEPLGVAVLLDGAEAIGAHGWLKTEDGSPVNSMSEIKACKKFRVPNRVFIDGGHIDWKIIAMHVHIDGMRQNVEKLGYKAVVNHHATAGDMRAAFKADYVEGFVSYGHGEAGAIIGYGFPGEKASQAPGFDWSKYYVEPSDVTVNYRLGFVYLFHCHAGHAPWGNFVSQNGTLFAPMTSINSLTPWLPYPW